MVAKHENKHPGYQGFFSRAARIFGVWPKADTSLAVARSHERRSREKNLWHGAVLFTVPVDLCAFLSDYIYANQIESLQL